MNLIAVLRRVSAAIRQIVCCCAIVLAASAVSAASPILYSIGGDDSGIPRRVTSMDPGLGTTSVLFDLGSPVDGFGYSGLTSSNGRFFAVQEDSFGDSELVSFLPNGGGAYTSVLALTAANAPLFNGGLTYDTADGNFYAMGNFSVGASNFYRINVGTNTITKLFEVLGNGYLGGVTYNALDNSFYAIQDDSSGNSTLQHITVIGNTGQRTLLFSNFECRLHCRQHAESGDCRCTHAVDGCWFRILECRSHVGASPGS